MSRVAAPAAVLAMAARRHHVVEASAGTGKTYLIERRVVDLIVRAGASIESILVVTFTEKATAELRLRIRGTIESLLEHRGDDAAPGEPCWILDDAARRRLRAALLGFDRAAIFTIHGFCNRVLAETSFASGRALRPRQVAGRAAFAATFADVVRRELACEPGPRALLGAWLGGGRSAASLESHLWSCIERGGEPRPRLDGPRLEAAIDAAARLFEAGDPLAGADLHPRTEAACKKRLGAVRAAVAAAAARPLAEEKLAALWPAAAELRYLAERGVLADLAAAAVDLEAAVASAFAPRLRRALGEHKRRLGQIDFSDMLAELWRSLEAEGGAALAAELRRRYPFALIDEFQDTDELQWNIFRRIYLESDGAWLTVVGDPKQAIYSFRGADLHTYLRARRELEQAGASRSRLATSYRATPALVDALSRIIDDEFFSGDLDATARVEAGTDGRLLGAGGEPAAALVVTELDAGGRLKRAELDARLAEGVAAEIVALLRGPGLELEKDGSRRRLGAGDVMVLCRTGDECETMAAALRRRGVATSLHQQRDLFATAEARELLAVLRAVEDPRSRAARAAALATRFFDLPLEVLLRLAERADGSEALAQLWAWKALADRQDLEALLPAILADSRIVERELALGRGERAITNVDHLVELLTTEAVRSRCTLGELCQRLAARIAAARRGDAAEKTPLRIEGEREAVQLMTVHAAKGLEAAVVFVAGGASSRSVGQSRVHVYHDEAGARRLHVGRATGEVAERVAAEIRGEDERLMYVAATRAAARLYLFSIPEDVYRVSGSYAPLNERLAGLEGGGAIARRCASEAIASATAAARADRPAAATGSRGAPGEPEAPRELDDIRRRRGGAVLTSYSRIKREAARQAGRDHPGAAAAIGELGGREVGIFLHWILERAPLEAARQATCLEELAADPGFDHLIGAAMRVFDVAAEHRAAVDRLIWSALSAQLEIEGRSLGALTAASGVAREVEFTYPVEAGGALRGYVSGALDVLFESDGRLYVLDWKSDALLDYGAETLAAHTREAYQVQLELYSLALARMLGIDLSPGGGDAGYERFGGLIYCYLRAPACAGERPDPDELRRRAAALAASEETWRR